MEDVKVPSLLQGVEQIGPGQPLASTQTGTPRPSGKDRGRFVTSGNTNELFAFRTVSLRQVTETAPYMHDGAIATLEEVIEFYDRARAFRVLDLYVQQGQKGCLLFIGHRIKIRYKHLGDR